MNCQSWMRRCCPDFSCCKPELAVPLDVRRAFVEHPENQDEMCQMFLRSALELMGRGKDIYIAGEQAGAEQ